MTPDSHCPEGEGSKLDSEFYGKITVSLKFWPGLKVFKICTKAGSLREMSVKLTDAMANE